MFRNLQNSRLRTAGLLVCLTGCAVYVGALLVFFILPLDLDVARYLGWLNLAGYAGVGLAGIGAGLMLASLFRSAR